MTTPTRMPEGWPLKCPVCGKEVRLLLSHPAGDAPCPSCGHLLWWHRDGASLNLFENGLEWFRHLISENLGVDKESLALETNLFEDLGADSLDVVELVMELEEELQITIPDTDVEKFRTVGDVIEYFQRRFRERE